MRSHLLIAFGLIICLCSGTAFAGEPTLPKAPYILIETAKKWLAQDPAVVLVDVRLKSEFDEGHLKGAVNIPYDEVEERVDEFSKDKNYIFYCIYSSWRAPYAANVLADEGHRNVYVLEGGVSAWNAGGQVIYPTYSDDKGKIADYPKGLEKKLNRPSDQIYAEEFILTEEELSRYNGKDGQPAFVAVNGIIYDVTQSRLWRGGEHDPSHGEAAAGSDLTEILQESPHGNEHLKRFPVVGRLYE